MKMCPKAKLTVLTRRKTFVLNVFRLEAIFWAKTLTHYIRHLPRHVWSSASYFALDHSFIRDCLGGVLDQALRTPKHDNLSVVLVFDMMPNDYGPNIKVVPLGNVKFLI